MQVASLPRTLDRRMLALLAALTAAAAVYSMRVADADLWGHLAYGKEILARGGLPGDDPFAYTTSGRVWNDHEYLAQMILWLAYSWGGPVGLLVLKCVLGGATMLCLYGALRLGSDDARVWAPLLALTAVQVGRWMVFRPQLFTFLLFSLYVLILFRHLLRRPAPLSILPALMALWVNLHGGFLAGIGAVGLVWLLRLGQGVAEDGFRVGRLARNSLPLLITLFGCLAASLVNPLGWKLWPYLATELGYQTNRVYIDEWQPLWVGSRPWDVGLLGLTAAGLLLTGTLAQVRRVRIAALPPAVWLLSCLPLGLMAVQSIRHIPILILWTAPVLALLAQAAAAAWSGRRVWDLGWLAFTGLVCVPTVLAWQYVLTHPEPRISLEGPVLGAKHPHGAVRLIRECGLRGRIYSPLWWGSYLTWELYPDILVAIDGRNVTLFSPEQVTANLELYLSENGDPQTPLATGADLLLFPTDAPLLAEIRRSSRWRQVYEDPDAVLFVRTGSGLDGQLRGLSVRVQEPVALPRSFP